MYLLVVPKDVLGRINFVGCMSIFLCGMASLITDGVPGWIIVALIAVWTPFTLLDGAMRGWRDRKNSQRQKRIREALDRDGHFCNLAPEDQEEINISWARHMLNTKERS